MKKQIVIALILLISLTTITFNHTLKLPLFNLQKIIIENNILLNEKDIRVLLRPIYNKNLLLLKNKEIGEVLMQSSFIESYKIKKKYPETLKIIIYEKKPIAILIYDKKKFYLSEKIELFDFVKLPDYKELPYVLGNKEKFKSLYINLKKIKFPLEIIDKYTLFESNRWDLETKSKKIIKLPSQDYEEKLKNYLSIKDKTNFKKYSIFDYRIKDQLILK